MLSFLTAAHTDAGISKRVNQDAVFLEIAKTDIGPALFSAVCDGMGGLSDGEKASAKMVSALSRWFETGFAAALHREHDLLSFSAFCSEMDFLIRKTAEEIDAESRGQSGTTLTALLMAAGRYYTANVGDSRVYRMGETLLQITKDQTVVQKEIDAGLITENDIDTHPQKNVLLQCVGASEVIIPEYTEGNYHLNDMFLLCSDGFRHKITNCELEDALYTEHDAAEEELKEILVSLTEINKKRHEQDNISAILIKVTDR